jgi:AraC-like DNA-binding protein
MSGDILSEVLRSVRLRGAVYYHVSTSRSWAARAPAGREIAAAVLPQSDHVMEYHALLRGSCWSTLDGAPPVRMEAGDIVLFPHGDSHVMASAPGMDADPHVQTYFALQGMRRPFSLRIDGAEPSMAESIDSSAETLLVCGFFGCDLRPFNPLIATLPRMLHLQAAQPASWTSQFLLQAAEESLRRRPGGEALLERMSEMMFVEAMQRHAQTLPLDSHGWLAGLRDRLVGRALALIHDDPAAGWTVDELGRRIGLSRSALHERFVELIGQPPMQYLANWRMQLAAAQLRGTTATVATIAQNVGYESEAAFCRAFRRLMGLPPATWRRQKTA